MGNTFGPNGFSSGSSTESQDRSILIVINRTHKPDVVVHFPDANALAGEDRAEIDFFLPRQMRPQRVTECSSFAHRIQEF